MQLHIVLHEPEIPQNTGSIGRTCVAMGATLHLIRPLGFEMDSARLKRAGLDYWPRLNVHIHHTLKQFTDTWPHLDLWMFTTRASKSYDQVQYSDACALVFGKETAGLPESLLKRTVSRCVRIPMVHNERSLNLSVSVGIAAYEALRQHNFPLLNKADPLHRL